MCHAFNIRKCLERFASSNLIKAVNLGGFHGRENPNAFRRLEKIRLNENAFKEIAVRNLPLTDCVTQNGSSAILEHRGRRTDSKWHYLYTITSAAQCTSMWYKPKTI